MVKSIMVVLVIVFFICFHLLKRYFDKQWHKKPLQNFPFFYRGKLFWYSRSVATTLGVFAQNRKGEWHILANKRGQGTPDFQGYWNIICGYLEHNVTGAQNCQKEAYEETGVWVPLNYIKFQSLNTDPSENRQNVSLRYIAVLPGKCEDYDTSKEYCETNEVSDIQWIPLTDIDKYQWAFNHNSLIVEMFNAIK